MTSSGHIYMQPLCEESGAVHGPFYVTNTLEVHHPELKVWLLFVNPLFPLFAEERTKFFFCAFQQDSGGTIAGGGVSIYYSHSMQLLFFSYAQGKNFIAPLVSLSQPLRTVFPVSVSSSPNGGKGNPQALCQWSEVMGHPGLFTCLTQNSKVFYY